MRAAGFALLLSAALLAPAAASADPLYDLYAAGKYQEAVRAGLAAHSAYGYAIAARAVLADAVLRPAPCMDCLKQGEAYARQAVAADPALPDGQIWLAVALGYESRLTGLVAARLRDTPGQSKAALDAAVKTAPDDPYAVSALGGWNIEVVRGGGAFLARLIYGASEAQGIALFDRAVKLAPGNVAVRYQIALSLAGYAPDIYRSRIESELEAAIQDTPNTAYEKAIQARAGELLSSLKGGNRAALAAKVRQYQGYAE